MDVQESAQQFRDDFNRLHQEVAKVIVGGEPVIDGLLTCLFAGGHCLLEGVPGLGKTLMVRTLSEALALAFSRIQFTPDLMPADIIGTNMIFEDEQGNREFQFRHGPIFANIVLADEINRATPKTQSALLEAMQEHTVSVARTVHRLDEHVCRARHADRAADPDVQRGWGHDHTDAGGAVQARRAGAGQRDDGDVESLGAGADLANRVAVSRGGGGRDRQADE